jgi:hypothetical protein
VSPAPGSRPGPASGSLQSGCSAQIRRSQASASSRPPPTRAAYLRDRHGIQFFQPAIDPLKLPDQSGHDVCSPGRGDRVTHQAEIGASAEYLACAPETENRYVLPVLNLFQDLVHGVHERLTNGIHRRAIENRCRHA